MVEELQDIKEIKSLVSSTLLALGKRATEREFRKNFYEQESESFNVILARFNKSFYQFMKSIPDVCRLTVVEDEIILERVTKSESAHMDNLSIEKKRIRPKSRSNSYRPNFSLGYNHRSQPLGANYRPTVRSYAFANANKPQMNPFGSQSANRVTAKPSTIKPVNNRLASPQYRPKLPTIASNPAPSKLPPPKPRNNLPTVIFNANVKETGDINKENIEAVKATITENPAPVDSSTYDSLSDMNESDWSSSDSIKSGKDESFKVTIPTNDTAKLLSSEKDICPVIEAPRSMNIPPLVLKRLIVPTQAQLSTMKQKSQEAQKTSMKEESLENALVKSMKDFVLSDDEINVNKNNLIREKFSIPCPQMKQLKLHQVKTEIKVSECSSPSQFLFQFNLKNLSDMMDELKIFYETFKDNKDLIVQQVVPGMTVAVFENGDWHRAEILMISGADLLVLFVDNGLRSFIKQKNIRLLDKMFSTQPRKSSKGFLSGVKPANSEVLWSVDARSEFFHKTKGKIMYAIVHGMKDGAFELTLLYDVEKDSPPKLSDYLISKGYADPVHSPKFNNIMLV